MLKGAVFNQIIEMEDDKQPIIYENHEINEVLEVETYIVIVKIASFGFRIYQGMMHFDGEISVKYMSVDNDMFKAMSQMALREV